MSSWVAGMIRRRGVTSPLFFLRRRFLHSSSSSVAPPTAATPFGQAAAAAAASFFPRRFLASSSSSKISADDNLRRVIDSEIDCVVRSEEPNQIVDLPDDFPFEVIDNSGDQSIILKREFAGETIQATVYMNLDEEQDLNEDDNDDSDEDDNASSFSPTIQMVVTIEKGEGPLLEFCCNFNDDELEIENMKMQKRDDPDSENAYEGPGFSILDKSLQDALRKYLEVRGIKHSLYDFLQEYMMNKDEREYLVWLKNMRAFIGK